MPGGQVTVPLFFVLSGLQQRDLTRVLRQELPESLSLMPIKFYDGGILLKVDL